MKEKRKIVVSLPIDVFEKLEKDAKRCLRTPPQQIDAIISTYFEFDVEIGNRNDGILDVGVIG